MLTSLIPTLLTKQTAFDACRVFYTRTRPTPRVAFATGMIVTGTYVTGQRRGNHT